jgi:hypothetical protein
MEEISERQVLQTFFSPKNELANPFSGETLSLKGYEDVAITKI